MKKLIGIAISLIVANISYAADGGTAQASENLHVFDALSPVDAKPYMIQESFAVDSASTHAWVEIEVTGDYWDAEQHREVVTLPRHVPGLQYNPKTKEVLIQLTGRSPVVCGTYDKGGFFTQARIIPSGRCIFTDKVEERSVDDGYHVRSHPFVAVDLLVKASEPEPEPDHSLMGKHP